MDKTDSNSPSKTAMSTESDDGNNSVLDKIMKMKQERLKILHEFNKEHEDEIMALMKEPEENVKKKEGTNKVRRKSEVSTPAPIRRSQRICTKFEDCSPKVSYSPTVPVERPPNDYGPMPGIKVGHQWDTRMECSSDGVHRPIVAGIHAGPQGAYSIALSGGYPEDVDEGYIFTYTGSGGRDLKGTTMKPKNLRTAPQTKDQELYGANYSLVRSIETGKPVRVIRGYKSDSVYAPESGYRYDGLYKVVKYWEDYGKTGFRIYRFKMVRLENQAPPPWEKAGGNRGSYCTSERNENTDPNATDPADKRDGNESSHKPNGFAVISTIECKDETELDGDIKECYEKLRQNSVNPSVFCENSNKVSVESSFTGWD